MHFKDLDRVHDLNLNHFQHSHDSCSVSATNKSHMTKTKETWKTQTFTKNCTRRENKAEETVVIHNESPTEKRDKDN